MPHELTMLVASKEHMDGIFPVVFVAAMCVSDFRCKNPVGNMDQCTETTAVSTVQNSTTAGPKESHRPYARITSVRIIFSTIF